MTTPVEKGFGIVKRAAKVAVTNIAKLAGRSDDPDVIYYDSLQPGDFETMTNTYGVDATLRYIQTMESRKAKIGKKRS